jgi:hypothetical protein
MLTTTENPTQAGPASGLSVIAGSAPARCATCKWWKLNEDSRYSSVIFPYDPVTYEKEEDEEKNAAKWGHRVRRCKHPRVVFYQRPDKDAAAVCDGSEYHAELLTGEDFGCVLHEPNNQGQSRPTESL